MHILLQGVVGSTAYGLAGPDSDVDRAGVFVHPTALLFGLTKPTESIVTTKPDVTYHEAEKAARLMLKCNPTAMEILWLSEYEIRKPLGDELIGLRSAFLSARRVREAYLGYATDQFRKAINRADGSFNADIPARRASKHARHLMRLVEQGFELYATGTLNIRVDDPQRYVEFGERTAADPLSALPYLAEARERFNSTPSALPDEPTTGAVESWLRRVRAEYYRAPAAANA